MKVAAYVPIKLNNTRLPGKNLKKLSDGTPICELLFSTLSEVNNIDEKYCFCSDPSIKDFLPPAINFLERSVSLDTNETQCYEIMRSFVKKVNPDIIVLTHVTSPFIKKETIEKCVDMVLKGGYDSAFAVQRLQDFVWCGKEALNFDPACAPRTQELPIWSIETNGVFVITREVFEQTNRRVGNTPFLCEIGFPEYLDINYPEDFEIVDMVYTNMIKES